MAIKLVGWSPKSLGIWRVEVEPLLIIIGLQVAETLSSGLGGIALWYLNNSEVHVKTGGVHFCFGGSGVVCGISLTDLLMLGITLAFYNIVNDFQNYVFSYDIYMNTGPLSIS